MEELVKRKSQFLAKNSLNSLLDQADRLARNGQFDKSFSVFSHAFRVGVVPEERISSLVSALLEFENSRLSKEIEEADQSKDYAFTCSICKCLFLEPVTLVCGHTFCKVCLSEERYFTGYHSCNSCKIRLTETGAVNVLITTAIQKCFPSEFLNQEKKLRGYKCVVENKPHAAIDCLNDILSTSDNFHCLCWRADAYLKLGRPVNAFQDIEQACKLRPHLARNYRRKALVLAILAQREGILSPKHEESVLALLRCCSLAPDCEKYRQELTKSLYELLSPKFTSVERNTAVLKLLSGKPAAEDIETVRKRVNSKLGKDHNIGLRGLTNPQQNWFRSPAKRTLQSPTFSENGKSPRWLSKEERHSQVTKRLRCGSPNISVRNPATFGSKEKEIKEDFDCSLCYNLLFEPVTTSCGHTFCRECLKRSLDHRVECPCCRTALVQYGGGHAKMEVTKALEEILTKHFTAEYNDRRKNCEEEMSKLRTSWNSQCPEVPIFVCTLAFPSVQCPLHVYEPRYRLMLRRCIDSGSRCFGMCVQSQDESAAFADCGTMLEINKVSFLPDGRSIIDTMGARRFRVISRGMQDGYHIAKVEWLEDEQIQDPEEIKEVEELNRVGYITMQNWFSQMSQEQQQCVLNAIGPVPKLQSSCHLSPNGANWLWWTLAALPLQDKPKLIILGMTSLLERLKSVIRFLQLMLTLQKQSSQQS